MASPPAARSVAPGHAREAGARLFLALWPDAATRARVAAQARAAHLGGRPVPAANLHLTLVFVGDVPASRTGVLEAIVDGIDAAPFDLTLDHLGRFAGARVAWAGCRRIPAGLTALQGRLDAAVRDAGFALETRAFRPHVTLARDHAGGVDAARWVPVTWPARAVALVRSVAGPTGPVYRTVRSRALDA